MMTPEKAIFASMLVCIAGALLTWLTARNRTLAGWLAFLVTAASATLVFLAVGTVLAGGASARLGNISARCRPWVSPCACMWTD